MRLAKQERSPLAKQIRENREHRQQEEAKRHARNEQVISRLRSTDGSRSA